MAQKVALHTHVDVVHVSVCVCSFVATEKLFPLAAKGHKNAPHDIEKLALLSLFVLPPLSMAQGCHWAPLAKAITMRKPCTSLGAWQPCRVHSLCINKCYA